MRLSIKCSRLISFVRSFYFHFGCLSYMSFYRNLLFKPPLPSFPLKFNPNACSNYFLLVLHSLNLECMLLQFLGWLHDDIAAVVCTAVRVCLCVWGCVGDCTAKSTVLWKLISIISYTVCFITLNISYEIKTMMAMVALQCGSTQQENEERKTFTTNSKHTKQKEARQALPKRAHCHHASNKYGQQGWKIEMSYGYDLTVLLSAQLRSIRFYMLMLWLLSLFFILQLNKKN